MSEETFHVTVTRVIYEKEGTYNRPSWFILQTSEGRATGQMSARPEVGERLKLTGRTAVFAGVPEIKFTAAIPDVPDDPHAFLTYVCSRADGVGDAVRDAIWEALGAGWREALRDGVVDGVGPSRVAAIRDAMYKADTESEKAAAIGQLLAWGATENLAAKAWDEWGPKTVHEVKTDPYRLTDLENVGFVQVDGSVAVALGIVGTDPRRMRAGVLYAVRQSQAQGSTLLAWEELLSEASRCLREATPAQIAEEVRNAFEAGNLVGYPGELRADGTRSGDIAGRWAVEAAERVVEYLEGVA